MTEHWLNKLEYKRLLKSSKLEVIIQRESELTILRDSQQLE